MRLADTDRVTTWHAPDTSPPWVANPFRLVSLWEMLEFNALRFVSLNQFLTVLSTMHESMSDQQKNQKLGKSAEFDELLCRAEDDCVALGLEVSAKSLHRIRDDLANCTAVDFGVRVREALSRVRDELEGRLFLFVPKSTEKYYRERTIFGTDVKNRFPRACEDIEEAGKCFALGRYTASVFHLMRVMEFAVQRLAKRLQKNIDIDRAWGDILRDVDAAVRALPHSSKVERDRKDNFRELVAYLYHVKDAWRNKTMHPKRTYTQEQAETAIRCVRDFMQKLTKTR